MRKRPSADATDLLLSVDGHDVDDEHKDEPHNLQAEAARQCQLGVWKFTARQCQFDAWKFTARHCQLDA
eukprot:scaffold28516_cov20-Tisochrysis_lutea.AAC.3